MKIPKIFIELFLLDKFDFMSLDSWPESGLIIMKIHKNIFMSIYRIDPWR